MMLTDLLTKEVVAWCMDWRLITLCLLERMFLIRLLSLVRHYQRHLLRNGWGIE